MRAFGPNVRKHAHKSPREFVLHIQVPLLDVRPLRLCGNGNQAERKECAGATTERRIARNVILHWRQRQRRRVLQRFRIGFVAVGVLPKYAVAAADSSLAVAKWIPGEAYARRGIPRTSFHATIRRRTNGCSRK